ncbi:MAG: DUF4238 domain-containing protein [Bacteroidales bacterium]|nr:DUF4238 domain-containing protein [Bacteroidales bacterium]
MKQHYIPRFYLRRFSKDKKSIKTYDKINCKSYNAGLMAVCCINDLYKISKEYINECNNEISELSIEHDYFASNIEPMLDRYLKDLDNIKNGWNNGDDRYRMNYYEKRELALHIATLYYRLPDVMNAIIDNALRLEKANADMLKHFLAIQTGDKAYDELKLNISCERPVLHAQLSYMDNDLLMRCASDIAENIFVFWTSKDNLFYTSDFPIVMMSHSKGAIPKYDGLVQYGGELMMTLSPDLAVSIYDRMYFKEKKCLDSCFIEADEKIVQRHNLMNYLYSKRHIFSLNGNFDMIESVYRTNGKHEFLTPNLRSEIISGLGPY